MKITVLFFATYRDQTKTRMDVFDIPVNCTVKQLLTEILVGKYPNLNIHLPSTVVSINQEFVRAEDTIPEGAEVAIFPPVSGGIDNFPTITLIVENQIDIDDLLKKITLPSTGAAAIFTGMVREVTKIPTYRKIQYLEYEAYPQMAEAKMRQIADEIRRKWPKIEGIAIVQRIGKLDPGIPTVLIACTSSHRNDGIFDAVHYGINRLKEIVPVWKKEVGDSDEIWIEGEYTPMPGKD